MRWRHRHMPKLRTKRRKLERTKMKWHESKEVKITLETLELSIIVDALWAFRQGEIPPKYTRKEVDAIYSDFDELVSVMNGELG